MKAVFPAGAGKVELREVPEPSLEHGEALVRMRACGICGTDLEKTRGETHTPLILGHEVSGVIDKATDGAQGISEGDRVVVHHHVSCGECYYCRSGDSTLCELYQGTNLDPCGFAEYFRVPKENVSRGAVLPLPERLSFEEGSFIEPLGCCLRSLRDAEVTSEKSVAVLGAGSTGVLMIQLLRARNVGLIVASDVSQTRLNFSRKIGADIAVNPVEEDLTQAVQKATDGRGADVVIVATGSGRALEQSLLLVRRGGVVKLFGMPPKDQKLTLDASRLFINEVKIMPSYSTTEGDMTEALELIASGKVKVSELVSHRFALAEVEEAFRVAGNPQQSIKVVVNN